jgi:hypothetical protein
MIPVAEAVVISKVVPGSAVIVKASAPAAKVISKAALNVDIETSVMSEVAKVAMFVGTVPEDQLAPVFQSLLKGLASQVPLSKLARLEQGKRKTAISGMKCCFFIWRYKLIFSGGVFVEKPIKEVSCEH